MESNHRILKAWSRAFKFGYFKPELWTKYEYLCDEHRARWNMRLAFFQENGDDHA